MLPLHPPMRACATALALLAALGLAGCMSLRAPAEDDAGATATSDETVRGAPSVVSVTTREDATEAAPAVAETEESATLTEPVVPDEMHPLYVQGDPLTPDLYAMSVAFLPDSLDLAFSVTKGYPGGPLDLFVLRDPLTAPGREVEILAELPAAAWSFRDLTSSDASGRLAAAVRSQDGTRRVYLVSPDGSELSDLTRGEIEPSVAEWLPDGSALQVLSSEAELLAIDPDSLERRVLATGLMGDYGGPSMLKLTWSPDGRRYVFDGSFSPVVSALTLVDATTGEREELPMIDGADNLWPFFSADGRQLFVLVVRYEDVSENTGSSELWTMAPSASATPRRLLELPGAVAWNPSFVAHPDGKVLYLMVDEQIWRVDTDGGGLLHVAGGGDLRLGRQLVFTRSDSGDERLAWTSSRYWGSAPDDVDPDDWVDGSRFIHVIDPRDLPPSASSERLPRPSPTASAAR